MPAVIEVVTLGAQGERGPQGVPGPSGGTTVTTEAGAILSGHRAMTVNASGLAIYADKDTLPEVVGVSTAAVIAGEDLAITYEGEIEHVGWSWTAAQPVYLGIAGALTQTPPSSGFLVVVGLAVSATRLLVDPEAPIALL